MKKLNISGLISLSTFCFLMFFPFSHARENPFEHPNVPLLDAQGRRVNVGSSTPYSGRTTCGLCHGQMMEQIINGYHFQQGRTDGNGRVVMKDNYFGDHRDRSQTSGRFGRWSQVSNWETASKSSSKNESELGLSPLLWIRWCGGCHSGSGPGEFDRDGKLLYNEATGKFGYELLGKTANDVRLDGDYAYVDPITGLIGQAPWDKTGLSGPDCLMCHRKGNFQGSQSKALGWRRATLAAADTLKDNSGSPVRAFSAAATAGQGWFSKLETRKEGVAEIATTLQIDYTVGVTNGSLIKDKDGNLSLDGKLVSKPADKICLSCHTQGPVAHTLPDWFSGRDVHFRFFNRLNDKDPSNDIPPEESRTCTRCHLSGGTHSLGKGREFMGSQNDLAWKNFLSCRECHLEELEPGKSNPGKHPNAPVPVSAIHSKEKTGCRVMEVFSCAACHNPYAVSPNEVLFIDPTRGGAIWPQVGPRGAWPRYLSSDPLNPSDPDKSRLNTHLLFKEDSDGKMRLFPAIPWLNIYWGDWDRKANTILPILNWRIHQVIPKPLPIATDDDGDGQIEINRPEEILAYIQALKGKDRYGRQVAENPVLVKGPWVWYEDPKGPKGVSSFALKGIGIPVKWHSLVYGQYHMILPAKALLDKNGKELCAQCHKSRNDGKPTQIMDRLLLVDPYNVDGKPVYQTVREMTGVDPK